MKEADTGEDGRQGLSSDDDDVFAVPKIDAEGTLHGGVALKERRALVLEAEAPKGKG